MTTPTDTNTLPHNREAEEALLASVLFNPEVFPEVRDLPAEAFYIHRYRWVWEACQRLAARAQPIDSILIAHELDDMGRLEEAGGPAFLTSLLNTAVYSFNADSYAHMVRKDYLRRNLLRAANEVARLAYDPQADPQQALADALAAVRGAGEGLIPDEGRDLKALLSELYENAIHRAQKGEERATTRVPSGWNTIDEILGGGFAPGKFYVVAGRPGDGKSTWLTNIALAASLQGKSVALFSLEMEQLEITARIVTSRTGMDANLLTDGVMRSEEAWASFQQGIEETENASLRLYYTPRLTPEGLRAKAHRMKMTHGLDLLIVDYLQLMQGDGRKTANRQEEVAAISRELKILAGELGVPVIAAAQLNRDVEKRDKREPQLSDLRESGAIENDADAVAFLYRPDKTSSEAHVKLAKNRSGQTGIRMLDFQSAFFRFVEQG